MKAKLKIEFKMPTRRLLHYYLDDFWHVFLLFWNLSNDYVAIVHDLLANKAHGYFQFYEYLERVFLHVLFLQLFYNRSNNK